MVDQGHQQVAARQALPKVPHDDRCARVEVECVPYLGHGAVLASVEAVDADDERDAAALEEAASRAP